MELNSIKAASTHTLGWREMTVIPADDVDDVDDGNGMVDYGTLRHQQYLVRFLV